MNKLARIAAADTADGFTAATRRRLRSLSGERCACFAKIPAFAGITE